MAVPAVLVEDTATIPDLVAATSQSDDEIISEVFQPSGSQKFRKRWIEFDCQKGVHHGKFATYENGKRIRVKGGYLGRFNVVRQQGEYGTKRVQEFTRKHDCHYLERFQKDLEECGIGGIAIEGWHSGRSLSGLPDGEGASGSQGNDVHRA